MRRHMQMVFQDPMASLEPAPERRDASSPSRCAPTGSPTTRGPAGPRAARPVGLPGVGRREYPHEFSGGQRQRIGIARAIALEPQLVIADEPVSALDVSIQAQVLNLLEELQERLGLTYLVIAHDLAVVRHICDEVGVMYLGGVVEQAPPTTLYAEPAAPVHEALMSAVPVPDPDVEDPRERILLAGDLPSPGEPAAGVPVPHPLPVPRRRPAATTSVPELRELAPGHRVACHWAEEIAAGTIRPHEVTAEDVAAFEAGLA